MVVGADIAADLVHRLSDPDLGGEVEHPVDARGGARHRIRIANVGTDQLDLRIDLRRLAMHLRDQRVEDADRGAVRLQLPRQGTADETAAAGDEVCRHARPRVLHVDAPNIAREGMFHPLLLLFPGRRMPARRGARAARERTQPLQPSRRTTTVWNSVRKMAPIGQA